MKSSRLPLALMTMVTLVTASAVHAQATRTWVSGVGDDANPCSRTAPCKTYAGAISKTAAGGEISTLDPGGFGAVTITKSITISGDGTLSGILASLVSGVIVNAGVNDKVVLRNISINGAGNGISGIRFLAGKSLLVDNVTITGFTTAGIDASHPGSGNLHVKDTTITRGGAANPLMIGIRLNNTTAGTLLLADIEGTNLNELNNGIEVTANSRAMISNSLISGNAGNGILANSATAVVNLEGCQIAFNALNGVNGTISGANIRLSNNEIYNNTAGVAFVAGVTVASANNNRVFANGASQAPNAAITIQ